MTRDLFGTLADVSSDLTALKTSWALVGGIAFQILVEARFTRDIDLAVAVADDRAAESLVRDLRARSYRLHPHPQFEQEATDRLATIRLIPPGGDVDGVIVDLLFASSGIEPEIVAQAVRTEVLPGLTLPVITKVNLLAVKILAGRPKDLQDASALLDHLEPSALPDVRRALDLIERRGFHRKKDLQAELDRVLAKRG